MKELREVQLDLLKIFLDVCKKLDLNYFLVCGSALGAVKYGGFIPWDDDIDVALKREDYEEFLAKAPALLPDGYFLSNIHTEEAFPLLMTKLRNTSTTLIEKSYAHLPINHGVHIDIFPLDGCPKGRLKERMFEIKKWVYNKARCVAYIYGYKFFHLNFIMKRYEKLLKKYPCEGSRFICNHANWQKKLEYADPAQYGDGRKATFEELEVNVPILVEEYLAQKYGNWRGEPPLAESHHNFTVCDTNKPYTEYIKK